MSAQESGADPRHAGRRAHAEVQLSPDSEPISDTDRQLEQAQRIANLGSWEWNVASGELVWSDEMYRIYGLGAGSDMSYERYLELAHPDDRELIVSSVRNALEDGKAFDFLHRIRRAGGGEERVLHCVGEAQRNESGAVEKIFGIGHDVTELTRTQQELAESERQFRLLAENMSDVILLQDHEGRLLYTSPSAERILGYPSESLIGSSVFDIVDMADAERWRHEIYQGLADGSEPTQTVVRVRRKDGEMIWLELATRPIRGEDGDIEQFLASGRDVSERIDAERGAVRYRNELEKRNRELQDFAYVASHDLQEPLRKIRAFSDLIEEEYGDRLDKEGLDFLARVQDAAKRMSTLISDLLAFSRVTTRGGTFEAVDLNSIVQGVLSDLEVAIDDAGAVLQVEELPAIEADPLQMRQLFQNLVGNALKFRKADVPLAVTITGQIVRSDVNTPVGAHELCRLEIIDNGMGFEQKYADRIFSPFQRLHHRSVVEGTGMGLAICRRIVERHEGAISVESVPEQGTRFFVDLPTRHSVANGT